MRLSNPNGPIAPALRAASFAVAALLLIVGGGLFFQFETVRVQWPWAITPFNALFVGAIFIAGAATMALLAWYGRWAPARLLLPMVFVFTALFLLVSLIYAGNFMLRRWPAFVWFAACAGLPAMAGYYLWRNRALPPPGGFPTPSRWRALLLINACILGLYGFAMFAAPVALTTFWPWSVDAFHGRLYSVVFTTLAIGALGLSQVAAPEERLALGLIYALLSLFVIFSVVIIDAGRQTVDWSRPSLWLWITLFCFQFALGLVLIWWSSIQQEATGERK